METAKLFERSISSFWAKIIAPLYFNTKRVAETALRAWWFWQTSGWFPGTWGIFSSRGDSRLTPACLGLHWNGQSESFWTLTFKRVGRNRAPFYFKTERVARPSWFWPISRPIPETWRIYSSQGDSKVSPDGLGLQWNGQSTTLELLGRNIARLYFKTERVTETALRIS